MKLLKNTHNVLNLSSMFVMLFLAVPYVNAFAITHSGTANAYYNILDEYQDKNYPKVILQGNNYLKLFPKDTDVRLLVGYAYYQEKEYQQCINAFTQILSTSNKYESIRDTLAQSYINLKDYSQALIVVEQGLKINPNAQDLLKKQVYLRQVIHQHSTKNPTIIAATQTKSEASDLTLNKKIKPKIFSDTDIIASYKAKQYNQVQSSAHIYLKAHPDDYSIWNILGLSDMKQKQYSKAEKSFKMSLTIKTNTQIRKNLINSLFAQKNIMRLLLFVMKQLP